VFKRIRLEVLIALDPCRGKGSVGPEGSSSRVVREQKSLVLFWSCANRICTWLCQILISCYGCFSAHHLVFSTRSNYIVLDMVQAYFILVVFVQRSEGCCE